MHALRAPLGMLCYQVRNCNNSTAMLTTAVSHLHLAD